MAKPPGTQGSDDPPPRPAWDRHDWDLLMWRVGGALLLALGVGIAAFAGIISWIHGRLDLPLIITAAIYGVTGGGLGGAILWATCWPLPRRSKRAARRGEPTQK